MKQHHTDVDKLAGSTIKMIVERLEEKEAVLASLEACWENDLISTAQRRRLITDVRRTLIDTVCTLESIQTG